MCIVLSTFSIYHYKFLPLSVMNCLTILDPLLIEKLLENRDIYSIRVFSGSNLRQQDGIVAPGDTLLFAK